MIPPFDSRRWEQGYLSTYGRGTPWLVQSSTTHRNVSTAPDICLTPPAGFKSFHGFRQDVFVGPEDNMAGPTENVGSLRLQRSNRHTRSLLRRE
jgi:hypothetical protein